VQQLSETAWCNSLDDECRRADRRRIGMPAMLAMAAAGAILAGAAAFVASTWTRHWPATDS
jgi:uncharacterized membrane protein